MAAQVVGNAPAGLLDAPAPAGAVLDWGAISPTSQDSGALALVPVPIHPRRARRRGYNQAALLAAAIAERTGLPVADCLERAGSAGAQVGRGRAARLAGPPGSVRAGDHVPERAVLVDDVVTTGGTLAAAAAALRAAGARHVAAVAFARTPGR
jgi:predicted amidophosphoribosyltransferase